MSDADRRVGVALCAVCAAFARLNRRLNLAVELDQRVFFSMYAGAVKRAGDNWMAAPPRTLGWQTKRMRQHLGQESRIRSHTCQSCPGFDSQWHKSPA